MNFSNESIDIMEVITLILPVLTFVMGYFLTGIEHKRERKLGIIREKFEKLYHPFYVMINELGTETEEGFAFSAKDSSVLKPLFDHFSKNMYLTSADGQKLFWETRGLLMRCIAEGENLSKELEHQFDLSMSSLFGYLIQEYVKSANILGYELGNAESYTDVTEIRD